MSRPLSGNRLRRSDSRNEQGYVAILVALLVATIMLPLCAMAVDVARWYVEVERLQNAADAAAMAGVTYMPDDLVSARAAAVAAAGRNGFPASSVTAVAGALPTQLRVTITSTVKNSFATAFGLGTNTISRSSVADYNGPAPMGSPCNTFGNEPMPGTAETLFPGAQMVPPEPVNGALCTTPRFWGGVAGPEHPKANGDAIMSRRCASSAVSGCTGTTNDEFDPLGYFYIVRVAQPAVNTAVTIQIYDPAFVETGNQCERAPDNNVTGTAVRNNMNAYDNITGLSRYAMSANDYCTGDALTSGAVAPVTSFALRGQTDTYRPSDGTPITGCVKQYKGYREADSVGPKSSRLRQTLDSGSANTSYNLELTQLFHQWVTLCTFTPAAKGDYYLQIRTNVPVGGTADGLGGYAGNANVYTQTGDNTSVMGDGHNRFALRATGPSRASVSISGWEHMSIYANSTSNPIEFNHVRVIPAAASKTLNIKFFDLGDAPYPGTLQVLPPRESNLPTPLAGCTGSGVVNGPVTNCQLTNVSRDTGWQAKEQTIRVPIPSGYTCESTLPGGCWFRLQAAFPGGVQDSTTWSARVEGDPVRLVE